MPVKWTPDKDQLLLLKILETHDISVNADKIVSAWPDAGEVPTARAIKERLAKIRTQTKAKNDTTFSISVTQTASTSASSTPAVTPRKQTKSAGISAPASTPRRSAAAANGNSNGKSKASTPRSLTKAARARLRDMDQSESDEEDEASPSKRMRITPRESATAARVKIEREATATEEDDDELERDLSIIRSGKASAGAIRPMAFRRPPEFEGSASPTPAAQGQVESERAPMIKRSVEDDEGFVGGGIKFGASNHRQSRSLSTIGAGQAYVATDPFTSKSIAPSSVALDFGDDDDDDAV